jgi:hypothetical protein
LEKNYAKLFNNISDLLTNRDFFQKYLFDTKHFTRKRNLPFQTVVLLILRLLKSSLQTELKGFYTEVFKQDEVVNWVSDAALSKARQKIKSDLFSDLSDTVAEAFYSLTGGDRWKGYRLLGVDGSEINLPSSKQLLKDFGKHHTNSVGTKIPQARVSFLTDVLNKITIDASIESFRTGEQTMLADHLDCVKHTDLLTADANYGHFWVLKKVADTGADYCFRISKSSDFVKGFIASGMKDVVLDWHPSKSTRASCRKNNVDEKHMKVRLVLIELENEIEILVTSLLDQQLFSYQDMQGLYNTRWAVEEEFKKFMQRLVVEYFSSLKTNGVRQDFHANVFMLNVVSLLTHESNKKVLEDSKNLKFRRCINWTSALGDVRQRLALLFLRSAKIVERIIRSLTKSFEINTEPIKPNRRFNRDKRKKGARKKAFICYKPAW